MKRCFLSIAMLCWIVALMGADFKATQLQREMAELLNLNFGMERVPNPELGAEYSFIVTEEAVKAMRNLQESATPIQIPNTNELAAKKNDVLKALGFIPRKSVATDQEVFKLDVTDVTVRKLRGKTVTILGDGTVKLKVTR